MPLSFSSGFSKAMSFAGITSTVPASPVFAFDTSSIESDWNFYLQTGFIEAAGYLGELRVTATNIPISTDTYAYYTILPGPGVTSNDLITNSYGKDVNVGFGPVGTIYIRNDQYYVAGEGFKNLPTGLGKFYVAPRNDLIVEGNETFQIQLRTGSTSGPVVVTSPVFTIKDPQ